MPPKRTFPNDPRHLNSRRFLRQNATPTEEIFWKYIRDRQLSYKFRRQYSLCGFIVDFYCHKLKLVIELDGWTHDFEKTKQRDVVKQNAIERRGYKIIRFTNEQVYGDIDTLLKTMQNICQSRAQELASVAS